MGTLVYSSFIQTQKTEFNEEIQPSVYPWSKNKRKQLLLNYVLTPKPKIHRGLDQK